MTVQIRSFTHKDLESLVRLLNEAYKEAYEFIPYTEEKLRSWFQERNLIILVSEENGEVTGSVAYRSGIGAKKSSGFLYLKAHVESL